MTEQDPTLNPLSPEAATLFDVVKGAVLERVDTIGGNSVLFEVIEDELDINEYGWPSVQIEFIGTDENRGGQETDKLSLVDAGVVPYDDRLVWSERYYTRVVESPEE